MVCGFVFRKDKEMESKTARMESRVAESQILLESHRNEMISFKEANHRLQVVNTFYNLATQCLRSTIFWIRSFKWFTESDGYCFIEFNHDSIKNNNNKSAMDI